MVLETDCPFLAPEPWRGKRNEPAMSVFIAAKIAELKGVPVAEVWRATGETAVRFFELEDKFEARSLKSEGKEKDISK
ncbi:MAG: TatD family hydrolase, partial [Desulfohalobiaceae bacterium]